MVNGWNVEAFHDKRNRRLLHLKKQDIYYQLNEKDEKFVTLLKNNEINAVSIAAIAGYFLKLHPVWWIVIMAVIYGAYLWFFNAKVLPKLSTVKNKKIEKKLEKSSSSKSTLFFGIGFFVIAIGLVLCIFLDQVQNDFEMYMVIGFSIFAFVMGAMQVRKYFSTRTIKA
ncbi:MAG: hypothetical protein RR690_01280 [Longicatena sp.]